VEAHAIMGPGVDPHLYKATQGDLVKFNQADVIVFNGLLLEGKMGEVLSKLGKRKPVVAAGEAVPRELLMSAQHYQNAYDPHIWFDVKLWQYAVKEIASVLSTHDSLNADYYQQNAARYLIQLDSLDAYVHRRVTELPESKRILVTAHDAFGYFGRAYGIRVEGLQGISTVADIGLRDITRVTDIILEHKIKAIFVETSVSDKTIRAVMDGCREKGHTVKIGGSLYSDAMGEFGTFEGTYIGMVQTNVDTMVESLK
jgi:manganese/zinc/iron transport system substrate-binding protein